MSITKNDYDYFIPAVIFSFIFVAALFVFFVASILYNEKEKYCKTNKPSVYYCSYCFENKKDIEFCRNKIIDK